MSSLGKHDGRHPLRARGMHGSSRRFKGRPGRYYVIDEYDMGATKCAGTGYPEVVPQLCEALPARGATLLPLTQAAQKAASREGAGTGNMPCQQL